MMKKALLLSIVVVLVGSACSQGSITLLKDDRVKFNDQISGQSAGNGGAFDWQVAQLGHPLADYGSDPPTVGEHFTTFCVELTQYISEGTTYKVKADPFEPIAGGPANTSGKTWIDLSGVFLFEKWSDGQLSWSGHTGSQIAAAVQTSIWKSEGYSNSSISTYGNLTASLYTAQITTWLNALGYTSDWTPDSTKVVELTTLTGGSAQDQIALVNMPDQPETPVVPEPASILVWLLLGLSVSGVMFARRCRG
jgi:hypothetical protein